MKIKVDWDTTDDENPNGWDFKELGLPEIVHVDDALVEEDKEQVGVVADWLSDTYGWCVNGWVEV